MIVHLIISLFFLIPVSCNEPEPIASEDNKPEINIISPVGLNTQFDTDKNFQFSISFTDDLGLDHYYITSSDLSISFDSTLAGVKSFDFNETIFIKAVVGQYAINISAVDTDGQTSTETLVLTKVESNVITVSVDVNTTYQNIDNFGASDAWSTQFVGKNWSDPKKEKMAEWLFSKENDQFGNPKGIGLSSWRFNIGAGSAEQGEASDINDSWRRAESFLHANGEYDWQKQAGQLWFLKKAAEYGITDLIAFVNSPPVQYTKNGKAYSEDGASSNLKPEYYQDYAIFLKEVIKNVASEHGVDINYISPVNEPQWDWKCCNQEGSPWNNLEVKKVVETLDNVFTSEALNTKIDVTEAGKIDFLSNSGEMTSRDNQIDYFFNTGSSGFIGNLSSVSNHISAHSYFTTYDVSNLKNSRDDLRNKLTSTDPNLHYWMSEYTILENNDEIVGNGRDLGMDPALYMARVVHSDLVFANASAWQWWLAISPYDYKDGLIYIDKNTSDGNYFSSKLLWGLGNYSRFIRPGMKRVATSRSDGLSDQDNLSGLMQSAYSSDNEIVVVFVNYGTETQEVKFDIASTDFMEIDSYQTSSSKDLSFVKTYSKEESILVSGRSIVTCILK